MNYGPYHVPSPDLALCGRVSPLFWDFQFWLILALIIILLGISLLLPLSAVQHRRSHNCCVWGLTVNEIVLLTLLLPLLLYASSAPHCLHQVNFSPLLESLLPLSNPSSPSLFISIALFLSYLPHPSIHPFIQHMFMCLHWLRNSFLGH